MLVERVQLRDFRCYEAAEIGFGSGLTIVHGANGSGKTNLIEALYFGCTARSFRTANERELVRFGAPATRVVVSGRDRDGAHELAVGFEPGMPKRLSADGAPVERLLDVPYRPLVAVFAPDRLELIKGPPGRRRAHLDQLIAALWPARAATRRAYRHTLAQRNALLARIAAGHAGVEALRAWDLELATHALALSADRARAVDLLADRFATLATELGLRGGAQLRLRPRSRAENVEQFLAELDARRDADLARAFTTHGPHRDELLLQRDGRDLRTYGSQGEQRLALLSLLLAERDALAAERDEVPLLLLDDVASELDGARRERLVDELRRGGQAILTATEPGQVPGAGEAGVADVAVEDLSQP